jgi:hypothetical protein
VNRIEPQRDFFGAFHPTDQAVNGFHTASADCCPMRAIPGLDPNPPLTDVRFPGGQFIQGLSACQRPMEERRSAPSYLQEAASRARQARANAAAALAGFDAVVAQALKETEQALSTYGRRAGSPPGVVRRSGEGTPVFEMGALRQIGWIRTRAGRPSRAAPQHRCEDAIGSR